MEKQNHLVRCHLSLGRRDQLWLKSVEFVGDSIVIDFSPDPCEIPCDLALAVMKIIPLAKKMPTRSYCISWSSVEVSDDA